MSTWFERYHTSLWLRLDEGGANLGVKTLHGYPNGEAFRRGARRLILIASKPR